MNVLFRKFVKIGIMNIIAAALWGGFSGTTTPARDGMLIGFAFCLAFLVEAGLTWKPRR